MHHLGLMSNEIRLPLTLLSKQYQQGIISELEKLNLMRYS